MEKVGRYLSQARFRLSTSPDFTCEDKAFASHTLSEVYLSAEEPDVYCVRADNLLSGTTYYWNVSDGESSVTRSFSTVYGEMRPIRLDGLRNVRDLGGRINADGRRVRQGLAYRGLAFDDCDENACCPYPEAARVARDDLGIRTEVDLREEAVGTIKHSMLGDGVRYVQIPFAAEGATLNDGGRRDLRRVLEVFADRDNYPIYFHCQVGTDRTGTIGMYLDAILGMSVEDIYLNYNFSSLSKDLRRNCYHQNGPVAFFEFLEECYPELTLPERLMVNLRRSGISEEDIEAIRSIMLE